VSDYIWLHLLQNTAYQLRAGLLALPCVNSPANEQKAKTLSGNVYKGHTQNSVEIGLYREKRIIKARYPRVFSAEGSGSIQNRWERERERKEREGRRTGLKT